MLPFAEHNCGDSMLKCIDCNSQICPKCMVQCPVGFRCPNCTKRFTSHVLQIDVWVLIRGFFGGLLAGLLFALLQAFFPVGGIYILFFVYFFGVFIGNILFKLSGRKLGGKVAASISAGILTGSICFFFVWTTVLGSVTDGLLTGNNKFWSHHLKAAKKPTVIDGNPSIETIKPSEQTEDNAAIDNDYPSADANYNNMMLYAGLFGASPISLALIIFLIGVISPFMGWNLSWPGFRR